jgi:hypothetical protein
MVAALQVFSLNTRKTIKNLSATKKSSNITMENGNFDREKPWSSDEKKYEPMNAAATKLGGVHLGMRPKPVSPEFLRA